MAEHDVNVANLPTLAFGSRAPMWWAMILMIAIESTIFSILFASYFYIRIGITVWPTPEVPTPRLLLPSVNMLLLLISAVPLYYSGKAIERGDRRKATYGLAINLALAILIVVLRFIEFKLLDFNWNMSIYGSLIWIILGFHTSHLIADTIQSCIVFGIVAEHRAGEKQQLGVQMESLYWNFVVISAVPVYLLVYIYPYVLRS